MTPRGERHVREILLGSAGVILLGGVALGTWTVFRPLAPRAIPEPERSLSAPAPSYTSQDLEMVSRKKLSRAIVKVAPPPPPKPVVPPLDLIVRLSGIIDYGADSPREAFIEMRASNQTRSYKAGDALPGIGAVVKGISDSVLVEYDGKLWKLTDRGAQPVTDPVSSSGGKP